MLLDAWARTGLEPPAARARAGRRRERGAAPAGLHAAHPGVFALGPLEPPQLRDAYAGADVLIVPSIATRAFREPWGLVVNEAMSRGLPVIASDAVGAAAGGLVRDGETGLVVPAGDTGRAGRGDLSAWRALRRCARRWGPRAAQAVGAYTHEAWARVFGALHSALPQALASVGTVIAANPGPIGTAFDRCVG